VMIDHSDSRIIRCAHQESQDLLSNHLHPMLAAQRHLCGTMRAEPGNEVTAPRANW
jgi:hypothetical protein